LDNFRELHDDSPLWTLASKGRCCVNLSIKASGGRRRLFTSELSEIHRSLVRYYPFEQLPPNVLRFVLPYAHVADAASTACVWGISAFVLHDDFEVDTLLLGVIFSGAAFFRILATAALFNDPIHRFLRRIFPNPRLFNMSLAGITFSALLMAMPNLIVFLVGFMNFSIFSGMLGVLLTEMQGSSTNTWESFTTQLARRIFTAGCIFALPNLYSLHSRLPLALAFWVAFVSTSIVAVRMLRHSGVEGQTIRRHRESVNAARRGRSGNKPEQNLVYAEQVMLGWLIKGKDL